jgi:hypothetical protein
MTEARARFPSTYCSQCGGKFGPGNEGFSHCSDHQPQEASRAAFEAWVTPILGGPPTPDGGESYAVHELRWAWMAWQAATQARDAEVKALRDALELAHTFIRDGVEFGYIKDTTNPDWRSVLRKTRAALETK